MKPQGIRRGANSGRTWLSACILGFGAILLLVLAGAGSLAGPVSVEPVTDLGLVQIKLPPGAHVLALPVQPASLDDLPGLLDVSLMDLESVETWDPTAQDFRAFFPKRPEGAAGEMKLASRIVRLTVDHPVIIRVRGTISKDTLDVQLAGALNSGFFGLTGTTPLTAGALLDALERIEPFVRGRDTLFMWDFDTAAWVEVNKLDPTRALSPAAAFRATSAGTTRAAGTGSSTSAAGTHTSGTGGTAGTNTNAAITVSVGSAAPPAPTGITQGVAIPTGPSLTGATAPPGGNLQPLARQTAPAPDGVTASDGTVIKVSELTAGTAPATAPKNGYTYSDYRFKGEAGRPTLAVASLTLPPSLVRLTNLPDKVPVRIYFKSGTADPLMLEVLGFRSIKMGSASQVTELRATGRDPKRPNLPLWLDLEGHLFTSGLTDVPAYSGVDLEFDKTTGLPPGQPVVLPNQTASLKYSPKFETSYTPTGVTTPVTAAAPAVELSVVAQPGAAAVMRWVDVSGNPGPWPVPNHLGSDYVTRVTTAVVKNRDFWIDPPASIAAQFTLGLKFPFTGQSMPAVLRTTDSVNLSAIDGLGVKSASFVLVPKLPLVGKLIPDIPIIGIDSDPGWAMRFHTAIPGLAAPYIELVAKKFFSIKLWNSKFIYCLHPEASDTFEVEFTPTPTYKIEGDGFLLGVAPRVTLRLHDFGDSDIGYYEELLFTVMPTVDIRGDLDFNQFVPDSVDKLKTDLKTLFFPLYALGRGGQTLVSKIAAKLGKNVPDDPIGASLSDSAAIFKKFFTEQLHYNGRSMNLGLASIVRFHDAGTKNGANRISAYGAITYKTERVKVESVDSMIPGTVGAFVLTDTNKNYDARVGVVYERFASPPVSFGIDFSQKSAFANSMSRETMLRIFASYQLPSEWGWAKDRAASGFWTLANTTSQASTKKPVLRTNRYEFRATDALSFSAKAMDLPGDLDDFSADLSDLRVAGSASEQESGQLDRDFIFQLSLTAGVIPQEGAGTGDGVKAGVLDFSCRRSSFVPAPAAPASAGAPVATASVAASPTPSASASPAPPQVAAGAPSSGPISLLSTFFPGPSALERYAPNESFRTMVDCNFSGIGNSRVRLENVSGMYVTDGARMASVGMGFRTSDGPTWGHADLTVTKTPQGWSGGGFVGNLKLADVVNLNSASVFVKAPSGKTLPFYRRLVLGAEFGFDTRQQGSFTDAGIKAGMNVDLDTKLANVFLSVGSDVFKDAGVNMKATGVDGTVTFTGDGFSKPDWDLTANASFVPPWEATQVANVAIHFAGTPVPRDDVGAEVTGLIPKIPIYEQGSIELKKVGLAYKRATKSFDYSGNGTVTLPDIVAVSFPPFLTIPKTVNATITGNSKAKFALVGGFDRPFTVGINEKLSLQLESFRFQKGSPFQLGAIASLTAGTSTPIPLNVQFDSANTAFSFKPKDPAAKVDMSVGPAALTLSNFEIKLSRPEGKGKIDISGDSQVRVDGAGAVSGTVSLSVDDKKDIKLALSGVKGAALNLGSDTGGFKIIPDGLSVSSKTDASGKRTITTSAAISLEFPSDWPGLGGQKVTGVLEKTPKGFTVSVLSSLDLGFKGLPIEIVIEKFTITKEDKDTFVGGSAILRFLRPLNTVLGENGDTPVELAADIALTKDKKVKFSAKLRSDLINIPFDMGFASGAITAKTISVSTGPDADMDLTLSLTKPAKWELALRGGIKESNFFFSIVSTPPLAKDFFLVGFSFTELFYKQLFPGFMGAGATFALQVGFDLLYRLSVDVKDFVYVLPTSLPPFGFPFFDELSVSYKFRGFGGAVGLQMRAPKMPNLSFALSFVKNLIRGYKDDDWEPMRAFLKNEGGDSIKAIFPGPGIGNIALGMPSQIRYVFPALKEELLFPTDKQTVIKLHILDGFHNITDLISKSEMANALVDAFEFVGKVGRVFSDPKNVVELIPKNKRAGSLDYSFAGSASIAGNYLIQETADIAATGSAAGLPLFGLLANLARKVSDSTVITKMADVIMMRKPLVDKPFTATDENGTKFVGQVKDTFIDLRQYVDAALELRDMASADTEVFSSPRALQRHLDRGTRLHGALKHVGKLLRSDDKLMEVTITGSSAPFNVLVDRKSIFAGSVPLFRTTTAAVPGGVLALYSHVEQESTQLSAVVTASILPLGDAQAEYRARLAIWQAQNTAFQKWQFKNDVRQRYLATPEKERVPPVPENPGAQPPNPGKQPDEASGRPKELGVVSKAFLFDIAAGQAAATVEQGKLMDWTVTHSLRADGIVRASFSSLGTMKFTAPATEFTYMYRGSLLPDLRAGLQRMMSLRDVVFGGESSPYMLGLTVWTMLFHDPAFKGSMDKMRSTGKRVDVSFKDSGLSMGVVLDDIGYYLTPPGGGAKQFSGLSGASDIESFRLDGDKLKATPFVVAVAGDGKAPDSKNVSDLVVFDGSESMYKQVTKARQPGRNDASDLSKLIGANLSAGGDPMIVRSLKLELISGQVNLVVRPRNIAVQRRNDGAELFAITQENQAQLDHISTSGSPSDKTDYPTVPGTFRVNKAFRPDVKGQEQFASVDLTTPVTSLLDLHAKLGTNILFRNITVNQPVEIAGTYAMLTPNVLQGTTPAFDLVGDPVTGMQAFMNANPAAVTATSDLAGSVKATLVSDNKDRDVIFQKKNGLIQKDFSFKTGQVVNGGFFAGLHLRLAPAGIGFDADIAGEIQFDGTFKFEGDVRMLVLNRDLQRGRFSLTQHGLTVTGLMDIVISKIMATAKFLDSGVAITGDVNVGTNGTGLFGTLSAGFPGDQAFLVSGSLKVLNKTIATGKFKIGNDGNIGCTFSLNAGGASISANLTFNFTGTVKVSGQFSASVDTFVGTFSVSVGASLSANGDVELRFTPILLKFNIATGSVSFDIDASFVNAFNDALKAAADAVEDFFSSW